MAIMEIIWSVISHSHPLSFVFSITLNEVFVLKNRLSDDWGWGSSQLTGESGLIPLNIMEECVSCFCVYVYHSNHRMYYALFD